MKIVHNICRLKKYFGLSLINKEIPKAELLSSNEALKAFGNVGLEYKGDILMMMAIIEYEYGRNKNYTTEEIGAVKNVLAEVYKFMSGCGYEWKEYERLQQKKDL